MDWIIENKDWIFSGIGVTILVTFYKIFFSKKYNADLITNKITKSGNNISNSSNTNNIQINITSSNRTRIIKSNWLRRE